GVAWDDVADPSPTCACRLSIVPSGSLLWSVKLQVSPLQLGAGKAAVGGWLGGGGAVTVTGCDTLPVAFWLSVTVSVTVNVPPAADRRSVVAWKGVAGGAATI